MLKVHIARACCYNSNDEGSVPDLTSRIRVVVGVRFAVSGARSLTSTRGLPNSIESRATNRPLCRRYPQNLNRRPEQLGTSNLSRPSTLHAKNHYRKTT